MPELVPQPSPDPLKELEDLKAANLALTEKLAALSDKPKDKDPDDLSEKARKEREGAEKKRGDVKQMETAIRFSSESKDWLKNNASLLPKSVEGIFIQADKENYDSAVEKASAIKVALVQEFFAQQSNMDLLTESQKSALAEFLKLTKTVKQDRAQQIYETVFEPTFESLRRIRKATELSKGGSNETDAEAAYKNKMITLSKNHYLGVKT